MCPGDLYLRGRVGKLEQPDIRCATLNKGCRVWYFGEEVDESKAVSISKEINDILLYVERIEFLLPKTLDSYLSSDFRTKSTIERYLQLISDKEKNILYSLYEGKLRIKGDFSALITASNQFDAELLKKIKERNSLRNTLVHRYSEGENDREVFRQAGDLSDVRAFAIQAQHIVETKQNYMSVLRSSEKEKKHAKQSH